MAIDFSNTMEGVIVNYRKGKHSQTDNHMVVKAEGIAKKDKALAIVGKKVTWKTSSGKELIGKVAATHGNSGAVRVIFERGMPGQSVGQKVKIE